MNRIGIVGGGQLARMLALAAHRLGLDVIVLDPDPACAAAPVAQRIDAPLDDVDALRILAACCDVVTFESENVPIAAVERIEQVVELAPCLDALAVASDRLIEKLFLRSIGIDTASFAPATTLDQLRSVLEQVGFPAIVKTRRSGYDGKGQFVARCIDDAEVIFAQAAGADLIVEASVPFDRELSVVLVRTREGDVSAYPVTQNEHEDGILRVSVAPAPALDDITAARAVGMASRLAEALGYVGVLTLELFEVDGELLANEFAPRVHNSGHWTVDGAEASQFENHVRAICGLPIGGTKATGPRAMVNLIGVLPDPAAILGIPGASLHRYGKAVRPGRKVGHVNVAGRTRADLEHRVRAVRSVAAEGSGATIARPSTLDGAQTGRPTPSYDGDQAVASQR